jgi:DNA-directed RNA polymerase subunit RPC12/RpoP
VSGAASAGGPVRDGEAEQRGDDAAEQVRCAWCGSAEVEQIAEWGPQLLAAQYMCQRCRTPFEWIKRR